VHHHARPFQIVHYIQQPGGEPLQAILPRLRHVSLRTVPGRLYLRSSALAEPFQLHLQLLHGRPLCVQPAPRPEHRPEPYQLT
jgi:hypothetical protein